MAEVFASSGAGHGGAVDDRCVRGCVWQEGSAKADFLNGLGGLFVEKFRLWGEAGGPLLAAGLEGRLQLEKAPGVGVVVVVVVVGGEPPVHRQRQFGSKPQHGERCGPEDSG